MNALGWRAEPEHAISEHTSRVLRWLARVPSPAAASIDDVSERIAEGFGELLDAKAISVWIRRLGDEDLTWAANWGEGSGAAGDRVQSGQSPIPVSATDQDLPGAPLWIAEANGAVASLSLNLAELAGFDSDTPPSLSVTLGAPLRGGGTQAVGVALIWLDSPDGLVSEAVQPLLEATALHAGQLLATAARAERLARSLRQLGETFATAIDFKDPRRRGHSGAVSYYAGTIARALDLGEAEVERIEFAALVHDIGRISVPDNILQKSTPLTASELEVVRAAPARGAAWLEEVDGLSEVADIVRHQGENYDGGGSPDGLVGEAIPLGSRIVAVATRFAAMTTPRADRGPLSVVGGALEGLVEQSGTSLDPRIVETFLRALGRSL